jgi:hypothetical protein
VTATVYARCAGLDGGVLLQPVMDLVNFVLSDPFCDTDLCLFPWHGWNSQLYCTLFKTIAPFVNGLGQPEVVAIDRTATSPSTASHSGTVRRTATAHSPDVSGRGAR